MIRRLLTLGLAITFLFGLAVPLVLLAMLAAVEPFPWRLPLTVVFILLTAEKIYAMCFRMRGKVTAKVEQDWTSVSVGLAYTLVVYAVILEFFFWRRGISHLWLSGIGFIIYLSAVALRYWAFSQLKQQWAIHVDRDLVQRTLIRTGPYRLLRHPLYLGAILETIGLALAYNAFWSLLPALLLFVPLEVQRAYFEDTSVRFSERTMIGSRPAPGPFFPCRSVNVARQRPKTRRAPDK